MARVEEENARPRKPSSTIEGQEGLRRSANPQLFLHPDQRVKDNAHRLLMGSFNSMMDGNIQGFLDAFLRWRVGQEWRRRRRMSR